MKLGFEVDSEIPVHRLEVWERMNGNGSDPGDRGKGDGDLFWPFKNESTPLTSGPLWVWEAFIKR